MKTFACGTSCTYTNARSPRTTRYVGSVVHVLITPKSIAWNLGDMVVPAGAYLVGTYDNHVMVAYPTQLAAYDDRCGLEKISWDDCLFQPRRDKSA